MAGGSNNGGAQAGEARAARSRRRAPWHLVVVAVLFVVAPFLTWYGTWFGRSLGDEQIAEYLGDAGHPRRVQHALSQLAGRIAGGDKTAARFYPQVVAVAGSESPDLRMTAAWLMGLEHTSQEFRTALLGLLEDPEPIVRRNAALALVRFGDARCRAELRAMLRPYAVPAPSDGTALTVLSAGTAVKREGLLARLKTGDGAAREVRSPLPGKVEKTLVREGEAVEAGRELFVLAPDEEQVKDALIGLAYFGEADDLQDVTRYAEGAGGMPRHIGEQAAQTAEAIKRRTAGQ